METKGTKGTEGRRKGDDCNKQRLGSLEFATKSRGAAMRADARDMMSSPRGIMSSPPVPTGGDDALVLSPAPKVPSQHASPTSANRLFKGRQPGKPAAMASPTDQALLSTISTKVASFGAEGSNKHSLQEENQGPADRAFPAKRLQRAKTGRPRTGRTARGSASNVPLYQTPTRSQTARRQAVQSSRTYFDQRERYLSRGSYISNQRVLS